MNILIIKILTLIVGIIIMVIGFALNHFNIENKDVRYILTAIGVGITIFTLIQLSTDIGTALFGIEGVNTRTPKPNP